MRKALPIVLIGLLASCSGGTPSGSQTSPSPRLITPSRSGAPLVKGTASVTHAGASSGTLQLNVDIHRSELSPAPANFKGIWFDEANNILALGGQTFSGTRKTSLKEPSLLLTYGFKMGTQTVAFASRQGECSVTMTATAGKIEGSFVCEQIKPIAGGTNPYRLSGTFSASV